MKSHWLPIQNGIFHESFLGPALFSLYPNDIVLFLSQVHLTIYADDIGLLIVPAAQKELIEIFTNDLLQILSK